jgi:DNA-binding MarR family transcriptional regulator
VKEQHLSPATLLASGAPTRYLLPYLLNLLVNRTNQTWRQTLRAHGLTVSRWQILSILIALDGCRVTTLAELAGETQPVTSRVVDQMERDDLVERRADPQDARVSSVWLTTAGREIFFTLIPDAGVMVDDFTAALDEAEVDVLAGLLTRMLANTPGGVGPVDALDDVPFTVHRAATGAKP